MARTNNLSNFLTDVADAIRTKKGSEELIAAEDFDTEIENLPSGGGKYTPSFISFYNYTNSDLQDLIDDNNIDYSELLSCNSMLALTGATASVSNVSTLDISKILSEGTKITSLDTMFNNREKLTEVIGFDKSNISNLTSFLQVFYGCKMLKNVDLTGLDTSNVTSLQSLFTQCGSNLPSEQFLTLNINNIDVSKVVNFSYAFQNSKIQTLDLSNWELTTNSSIAMEMTFMGCRYLTHLDIRKMDFSMVSSYSLMFSSVPNNCEIIVKDDTQKSWITSKFSNLTNVKTVAEYEAEQNA